MPRRRILRAVLLPRVVPAVVVLAALASPSRGSAQAPTFNTALTTYTNASFNYPNGATAGDFNGDGKPDVFVPDNGAIRMMLGNGNGTFTEHDLGVAGGGNIVAADLNGDGRLDAVVVRPQSTLDPVVLLNTGNDANGVPQFTATDYTPVYGGLRSITVGDLNGDGHPDFVVGSAYGNLQVYLNNGHGVFTRGQSYNLTPGGGASVGPGVIADFDGDGKADYLVASNQNHGANLFLGNGDGTFQPPIVVPNTGNAVAIAAADLNGDGKPDFVVGNTDGTVGVFLNAGGGSFSATSYSVGTYSVSSVAVADLNGDGKEDVVASLSWNYGIADPANSVAAFLGDGHGALGTANLYTTNWQPGYLSLADFNGDGKPDVETVGYRNKDVGVLLNTTPAALPTQTLTILGGSGNVGDVAANVEYYNPATGAWQPTYLTGWHPWGFVEGTNSWINYKPSNASDPGAGPTPNQTLWYLYRVRFTVPADAIDPQMKFSLKADNFAQVAINGVPTGGSPTVINYTTMNNVITGSSDGVNADGVFSQAIHPGENTITINVGDCGGIDGFNFRIDLSMKSSQPVQVVPTDTTPPVITAPADITAEATSAAGAAVTFTATATDAVDGPVPVVAVPASGSTFPLGTTIVGLSASDAAHNTATGSFKVTVQDTTPPVLTVPASQTLEATGPTGAVATFSASATDLVTTNPAITYSAASGGTFPIGTTTVNVTATDAAGNASHGSFTVTVRDTTPPTLTVPANQTLEATGPQGAAATFSASATDAVTANPTITYSAASGGTFPLGTTTVNVTATDAAGNASHGSFTITVRDTTPPVLTVPANQTLEATGPDGAVATFSASATDLVTANPTITYSAASGGTFPLGTTTVNVTATDGAGNASHGSFTITVRDTTPPVLTVPANQTLEATGPNGAVATFSATATDLVTAHPTITYSAASGSTFPLGTTTVDVTATDGAGNASHGSFTVTVRDTTPPAIASVTPSTATLWPPNHQMVEVSINVVATDAVGVASRKIVSVTSNEPDNGLGDGDTPNDIQVTGDLTVNLRAERSGTGTGRIYTIVVEAKDAAGNASRRSCTVSVPKSRGK